MRYRTNLDRMMQEQFSNFNWGFGQKTEVDKALSKINKLSASDAQDVIKNSGNAGSINDGRRNTDGSINWKDILQGGADVLSQFGNQNQADEFQEQDWEDRVQNNDVKEEATILGMHPVTFSVVALAVIVVGGVVVYKVTNK